jgi:hypothetical protein
VKVVRVRRWLIPAATLSLALAATLSVIAWELADEPAAARPRLPTRVAAAPPAAPAATPRTPDALTAPRPSATPRPAPRVRRPVAPPPAAIEPRRTPVRETPAVRRSAAHLARVVTAGDLRARLDVVDELARELPPVDAADALIGLLDGELPGEFYEAQTLRLGILAALGRVDAPVAREALAERLAAAWPRQERLMAIEMLAARADARPEDLLALSERDPDAQVRSKARWALQRLQ